jgi:ribonucleoside-diphosphate reductase alpha chain
MKADESDKRHTQDDKQDLLQELLQRRYLLKDRNGRIWENSRQMFERVSKAIAAPESGYGTGAFHIKAEAKQFFHLMSRGLFLPNSPTLMNAGRPQGMLSACFVLGIKDSIEGIFETIKRTALVQKAGGRTT